MAAQCQASGKAGARGGLANTTLAGGNHNYFRHGMQSLSKKWELLRLGLQCFYQ
jgi:hypothetical protein